MMKRGSQQSGISIAEPRIDSFTRRPPDRQISRTLPGWRSPDVLHDANPEKIEKDWITNFFDKCRLISDEEMQRLWAKLLASEANSPGNYSKRTITTLSTLDKADADLFRRLCTFTWLMDRLVPIIYSEDTKLYLNEGLRFDQLTHLRDIGLIRYESEGSFILSHREQSRTVFYHDIPVLIRFRSARSCKLDVGNVLLTKVGEQLAPLCGSQPNPEFFQFVVRSGERPGLKSMWVLPNKPLRQTLNPHLPVAPSGSHQP